MRGKPSPGGSSFPGGASGSARRFAVVLLVTSLAVVAGCALFNALVDPYGIFRWLDRPGFNEIKPRATQESLAFKYKAIDFLSPRTLLLGNSRAEIGWDPGHLSGTRFGEVVNAAMPGRGLEAMIPVADHAWARSRPATLVIGVEFFDCLEAGQTPPPRIRADVTWAGADEDLWRRLVRLRAFAAETMSLDATTDSFLTLLAQRNPNAAHLRRDGFQPAREYPQMQAIEGARKLFLQRDNEYASDGQASECFAALDELLAQAQRRAQTVYVATYPYHARLLELIFDAGLWQAYEDWKKEITDVVAARRRGGLDVSLRDFGAYHRYAVEPIPGPGGKGPAPKWYWESGHFRAELGAVMIDVLVGERPPEGLFGVELSPATIAAHLDDVRKSRAIFVSRQPDVVAEMAGIASRACRPVPSTDACPDDARWSGR